MNSKLKLCIALFVASLPTYAFATLSCSITTAAACTSGTIVLRMSGSSDAHAELPSQSTANYASNVICCSGSQTIGTSCSGTTATVVSLQKTTTSHVQQWDQAGYTNDACMSVAAGSISVAYQATNCTGYDTTLASISASTNAHIGNTTAYPLKICGSENGFVPQTLTFAVLSSTSTAFSGVINFGTLLSSQTSYASSTALGDTTETTAHTLVVNTNAGNGYAITVQGATLTASGSTIAPLLTNTAPSIGTPQFGMRLVASGGTGSVTSPYAASGFAYTASATTSAQVASDSAGDSATTTYAVRYMANIAGVTASGDYSSSFVYVVTATF
jgi:hypothetical protein